MEIRKLTLIQQHELDIMRVLLKIFQKENIHYFMQGGTMLGAVRHQGFIPWDDDIDIGVLRPDYERFVNVCEKYLPENMKLRTYWDDTYHHYYFSRIVDTQYHIKREGALEKRFEELWVDIFPLDGLPAGNVSRKLHETRLLFQRFLYSISCFDKINIQRPGRPFLHKVIIKFMTVSHLSQFFSSWDSIKILNRIDKLLKKYKIEESEYIINFMGDNHLRGYTKRCYGYGENVKYRFEDLELVGLKDYDYYLKALYNDYMKLPAEEERNIHVAELVEKE